MQQRRQVTPPPMLVRDARIVLPSENSIAPDRSPKSYERWGLPSERQQAVEEVTQAAQRSLIERIGIDAVDRTGKLLDQQCWLWGQDVVRLSANGLVSFGFQRHAPPFGSEKISCYTLTDSRLRHVGLWGFGAFYGRTGVVGIFLKRYSFGPCLAFGIERAPICWTCTQWKIRQAPDDRGLVLRLVSEFLVWIVEYERWINQFAPRQHRADCLMDWKKCCCGPDQLIGEWESLCGLFEKDLESMKQPSSNAA
ncbi:MAG: hypothetical protein U0941_16175 [Planctomycetaceae bacterium]